MGSLSQRFSLSDNFTLQTTASFLFGFGNRKHSKSRERPESRSRCTAYLFVTRYRFCILQTAHRRFQVQYHCTGSSTAMVVPFSELSSTQTEPPWRLAISHTSESPSPAPPYSRLRDLSTRKKGWKMLCQSSCGMPLGSKGVVQPLRHHSGSPCRRRLRTMVSHRARSSSITKRCMRAFPFISPFLCCFS